MWSSWGTALRDNVGHGEALSNPCLSVLQGLPKVARPSQATSSLWFTIILWLLILPAVYRDSYMAETHRSRSPVPALVSSSVQQRTAASWERYSLECGNQIVGHSLTFSREV